MLIIMDKPPVFGKFQPWNTFLYRTTSNYKEMFAIRRGESTVPFCQIGRD